MAFEALRTLMEIIPPPKQPRDSGQGRNWVEVERSLGTGLPDDYKEYVNLYGTGEFGSLVWVYNPFARLVQLNLLVQVPSVLNRWRLCRETFPEMYPSALYPEFDGLLPWGSFNTGGALFWRTHGKQEDWTVVVSESRGPELQQFNLSMTEFLAALLTKQLRSDHVPGPIKKQFLPSEES